MRFGYDVRERPGVTDQPPTDPAIEPDIAVQIGPVRLKCPILTASGTCGYALEYAPFVDLSRLGGFTTKSVTLKPRPGNAPPRVVETAGGMLNAIGLANVGLDAFLAEKVPDIEKLGTQVFVNVAGHAIDEYVEVCRRVDGVPCIAGVELNVSCPNVADGLTFGRDAEKLRELVRAVRPVVRRGALIDKLSPNVTDIRRTARAAIDGGADALSLVNTFLGMAIDVETKRPVLANGVGGLSGPAIKPLAVHLVHEVYRDVARGAGVPIIGIGGIRCWQDAVEFMLAGATAVSVGTALYVDPTVPIQIIDGLTAYLKRHGLSRVGDIVGGCLGPSPRHAEDGASG
jgi:dihydroorotate dehydrogenase (NAD+) catalytic subunit